MRDVRPRGQMDVWHEMDALELMVVPTAMQAFDAG